MPNRFVSILMPSRERIELAKKSIESLGKEYLDNDEIEVLIIVDVDDPQLRQYEELADTHLNIRLHISRGDKISSRFGYERLHRYYNRLANRAYGDWLMLWNDDATMETPDWVEKIKKFDHKRPMVLSVYHEENNLFPLISRKWFEIVRHFSLSPHVDNWVQEMGNRLNLQFYVPGIKIEHLHNRLQDKTYDEKTNVIKTTAASYRGGDMQALLDYDVYRITEWMRGYGR